MTVLSRFPCQWEAVRTVSLLVSAREKVLRADSRCEIRCDLNDYAGEVAVCRFSTSLLSLPSSVIKNILYFLPAAILFENRQSLLNVSFRILHGV